MEGKITRTWRLLLYWWKFKGCQKISGLKSIWKLQNPGSMKKFRVIRKDFGSKSGSRGISLIKHWSSQISGLKSGSREVSLIEALKYPVYNPVQGKDVSHKALKLLISGLKTGSREICLPQGFEALKSGSNIRLKVNLSLTKLLSSQIRIKHLAQGQSVSHKVLKLSNPV